MTTCRRACYTKILRSLRIDAAVFLTVLVLALLPGSSQAANSIAPLVLEQDGGTASVTLARGQELRIILKENPTTGYVWSVLQQDPELLELVRKTFLPPDKKIPGAPGRAEFVFKALGSGETRLELAYFRRWEGAQKAAARFLATIQIQ